VIGPPLRSGLFGREVDICQWLDPEQLSMIVDDDVIRGMYGREQAR
jgi:hypothetical protein